MFLKYVYTVFIGILLATFVGVGIQAFYPSPKQPEYISGPFQAPEAVPSSESAKQQADYNQRWQDYQTENQTYNKLVSILSTLAAIIILTVSLTILKNMSLFADGFMFGGILTQLYSIFRGFTGGDDKIRFVVVSVGFAIALAVGYIKFNRAEKKK